MKQHILCLIYYDDGSIKTEEGREELQSVKKSYNPDTGESQDDYVRVHHLSELGREIDRCKEEVTKIEANQAEWEQIETDFKAL